MQEQIYFTAEMTDIAVSHIARSINKDGWFPDVIVGLTRGGLIPAVMLSHKLNVRMMPLNCATRDYTGFHDSLDVLRPYRDVLIVDDIIDTGASMNKLLYNINIVSPLTKVRTATLAVKHNQPYRPNYHWLNLYEKECDAWVEFYWESKLD